jgi:hypothetical protein
LRWTSKGVSTMSVGFEPTPRVTDFDSVVVVTAWLRLVRWASEETIYESMSRYVPIDKTMIRQVLNLHNTRETDFDSDVVTTWLEPLRIPSRGNHHESTVKVCSDRKKTSCGRF